MAKSSVLVLYNQPLLPRDHPDAESEHSVVRIANEMARILADAKYGVTTFGLGADPQTLWSVLKKRKPSVVFNLYEGTLHNAESESYVAGLLEWSGIPFTGSPPEALSLSRAKHTVKYLMQAAGLPTADFLAVDTLPAPRWPGTFPVIVKPAKLDGSVGLAQKSVCVNQREVRERLAYLLTTYGPPVIVEEYLDGREFNVPLIELPNLQVLPPLEVTFVTDAQNAWAIQTYDGKWERGSHQYETTLYHSEVKLSRAAIRRLDRIALKAYRLLGCRDYARVDFRCNAAGEPFILEVNPNPEISEMAGFAGCLDEAEVPYKRFIVRLVEQALSRKDVPKPTFAPVRTSSAAR